MTTSTPTSVITVASGAALGVLALILTYSYPIGFGFFAFVMILLGALFAMARIRRITSQPQAILLLIPILFFTAMLVIRADNTSLWLNLSVLIGLTLLMLHFFTAGNLWRQSIFEYPMNAFLAGLHVALLPFEELINTRRWLRERNTPWKILVPIFRGLVITIPLVVVFVILLSSADEVFSQLIGKLINRLIPKDFAAPLRSIFYAAIFAWVAIGILGTAFVGKAKAKRGSTPEDGTLLPKNALPLIQLGTTEAVMALGGVCAVFGAFVVIQFVYLFGGEHNIANYNYADYVHRGFMELVAVAVLTLGMVFTLNETTTRRTALRENLFRGLSTVLIALTGVILVSAFQRMRLYELVYGFTVLRLQVYVFIICLGALFAGFTVSLYWKPRAINVFGVCALLSVLGFVATLDVLNPDAFVTAQNIQRGDIDPLYLGTLSVEAVPALTALLVSPEPGLQQLVRDTLNTHLTRLTDQNQDIRGFNLGRANALAALNSNQSKLSMNDSRLNLTHFTLEDYIAFLKPGMSIRQVTRQFGRPTNNWEVAFDERIGLIDLYFPVYYLITRTSPVYDRITRTSNGCIVRLQFDTAQGLTADSVDRIPGTC